MNFCFYSKYNGKSTIEQLRRVTFFVSSSSFHIVYTTKFNDYHIKATIGISNQLIDKYKSDKVIILSNEYTDEEILFFLCYELAHYIYDSNPSNEYSHTYRINDIELRAIRFADALLMPITSFKEAYIELSHNIHDPALLIHALSNTFNAPQVAVERRIKQVINTYESH